MAYEAVNPYSGERVRQVADHTDGEVEIAVTQAQFPGSALRRRDMAEALAFAIAGKVQTDIERQPLSSRLEHGNVASRVGLDFAHAQLLNGDGDCV
jgi:hypothetical protein